MADDIRSDGRPDGMIAFIPRDPQALAVPGGDPAEQIHMTVVFLGDDAVNLPEAVQQRLKADMAEVASMSRPQETRIFAHARWNPDGGPDGSRQPATVYEIEPTPELMETASWVWYRVREAMGEALFPEQFRPWKPHVTAGFGEEIGPEDLTAMGDITFDVLRVAIGGEITDFPLTGSRPEPATGMEVPGMFAVTASGKQDDIPISNEIPVSFPVLIVEGMETADGRFIEPGALGHRALPLPVMAQTRQPDGGEGHAGAEVIGRLDVLERVPGPEVVNKETGESFPEGTFVWRGRGVIDADSEGGKRAKAGYLTGNSADLSDVEAEFVWGEDADEMDLFAGPEQIRMKSGKIAATTLVPIPAFAEAYIQIDGQEVAPADDADTTLVASLWRSAELGDECGLCLASGEDGFAVSQEKRDRAKEKGHAMPDGSFPIENEEDLDNAIQSVGRASDQEAARRHIIKQAKRLGLEDKIPDHWKADGTVEENAADSITASVTPILPPADAFRSPGLTGPTALTVDEERFPGFLYVYAHLATWGTCHTGFAGQCVTPPRSATDYSYFNVGAVRAQDGDAVREMAVGHITMGEGGHASTSLSAAQAVEHYDNINTVVADVAAGEDEHGIWVAGIVRRSATPEQVEALRASPLSGDWRRISGSMELVAALAVNTGGFPVPRARVASGVPEALVAAGVLAPDRPAQPSASERDEEIARIADAVVERLRERELEDYQAKLEEAEQDLPDEEDDDLALRQRSALARLSL